MHIWIRSSNDNRYYLLVPFIRVVVMIYIVCSLAEAALDIHREGEAHELSGAEASPRLFLCRKKETCGSPALYNLRYRTTFIIPSL